MNTATRRAFAGDPQTCTEEQYLARNRASLLGLGNPALHNPAGHVPRSRWRRYLNMQADADADLIARREQLREEYREKLAAGDLRRPTTIERLRETANGHPDNASVQAARRILIRRGIGW